MRDEDSSRQRGRPASPPGSTLGEYLRGLRLARGWTIRELARAVGLTESAAAYISQMETGTKVPNADLAQKLAEQLGDPKGVFPLWSEIGGRKDPHRAAAARRELARILQDPSLMHDARFARPGTTRFERLRELLRIEQSFHADQEQTPGESQARWIPQGDASTSRGMYGAAGFAGDPDTRLLRLPAGRALSGYRVPILPEGTDPDTAREMFLEADVTPTVEFVRLSPEALREKKLWLPFAYRVTEASILRVGTVLHAGDVVVISQEQVPIVEHEIYAIRHQGAVELAHALWNGKQLLLLPDAGKNDFVTLEAEGEDALARLVVGHMVTVIRAGSSQTAP